MSENINIKPFEDKAKKLKVLGHPYRLFILQKLLANDNCKSITIQESINLPQATYAQHIGKLKESGIIKGIRHGREIHYKIVDKEILKIIISLLFDQQTS